jgi:tetratricopeptide (TPR) repeat protein
MTMMLSGSSSRDIRDLKTPGMPLVSSEVTEELANKVQAVFQTYCRNSTKELERKASHSTQSGPSSTRQKTYNKQSEYNPRLIKPVELNTEHLTRKKIMAPAPCATDVTRVTPGATRPRQIFPVPSSSVVQQTTTPMDDKTFRIMRQQGAAHLSLGEFHQARAVYVEILATLNDLVSEQGRSLTRRKTLPNTFLFSIDIEWAELLFREGEFEGAREAFDKLEDQPSEEFVKKWEVQIWLGQIYEAMGRYDQAHDLLKGIRKDIEMSSIYDKNSDEERTEVARMLISTESLLSLIMARKGMFQDALIMSDGILKKQTIITLKLAEEERKEKVWLILKEIENLRKSAMENSGLETKEGDAKSSEMRSSATRQLKSLSHFLNRNDDNKAQAKFLRDIQSTRSQVLWITGRRSEARTLNDSVLQDTKDLFGSKHIITLEMRVFQAELLLASGKVQDAEDCCRETLKELRRYHDKRHPTILWAYECRVSIHCTQGRLTEALNTAKALVSWSKEKLGSEHPQTFRARSKLAMVYAARGEFEDAILLSDLIQQAAPFYEANHLFIIQLQANLATILRNSGDIPAAVEQAFKALHSMHHAFNLDAFGFGIAAKEVINDPLGNLKSDIIHPLHAIESSKIVNQPYTQCLFQVLECLGICESERVSGDLDLSKELLRSLNAKRKADLLAEQPDIDTLSCMHQQAMIHRRKGSLTNALEYLDEVLEKRTIMLGHSHQQTLLTRFEQNLVYFYLDEEVSIEEQQKILYQIVELLGDAHVNTITVRSGLSDMLLEMGYLEEAKQERLKSLFYQLGGASKSAPPTPSAEADMVYTMLEEIVRTDGKPSLGANSRVLSSIERLAEIECEHGNYDRALVAQEAHLYLGRVWGLEPAKILDSTHDLAYMYQTYADSLEDLNRRDKYYQKAMEAYNNVLKERDGIAPPNKQLFLTTQINYGSILFKRGDFNGAQKLQIQVLQTIQGDDELLNTRMHVDSLYNLALTKRDLGNSKEAQRLVKDALQIATKELGIDDPMTATLSALVEALKLHPSSFKNASGRIDSLVISSVPKPETS